LSSSTLRHLQHKQTTQCNKDISVSTVAATQY